MEEKSTCYLVEVNGLYFVCEDKPNIKVNDVWQTDGMHVEFPYFIALKIINMYNKKPEKNMILDITDHSILF